MVRVFVFSSLFSFRRRRDHVIPLPASLLSRGLPVLKMLLMYLFVMAMQEGRLIVLATGFRFWERMSTVASTSATLALRISRTAWRLHIDHLCPFAPQDDLLVLPGRSLLLRLLWALRSREARTFASALLRSFSQVEMIYSCTDTPPFNPRMSNVAQVQTRTGKYHLLNGLLFFIIL